MKELKYLNKYFIKYKYRFLLGILATVVAQIFMLMSPKLISNSFNEIELFLQFDKNSDAIIRSIWKYEQDQTKYSPEDGVAKKIFYL